MNISFGPVVLQEHDVLTWLMVQVGSDEDTLIQCPCPAWGPAQVVRQRGKQLRRGTGKKPNMSDIN